MKFRPYAALVAVLATAASSVALMAPAQAAATDPVTDLLVASQTQVGHQDVITATWTPNDTATTYRMTITDNADGSGAVSLPQDVTANTASISTSALAPDNVYYVAVVARGVPGAVVTTQSFIANTLDTTGPTATYQLNRTSGYISSDFSTGFSSDGGGVFLISQMTAPHDDTTPSANIIRSVTAGDGSAAQPWTETRPFALLYSSAGSYKPFVTLTDQFGNSTRIDLPTITVKRDITAPRVHIRIPLVNPYAVASWRRIRGTATDSGSGVQMAMALVVQKRGTIWYVYDFHKRKWIKGYATLSKTMEHVEAVPAVMHVTRYGTWHTPYIVGLRRGPLHVEAVAFDKAFNVGQARPVTRTLR